MISRFSQFILASTTVTPLLLSIAMVIILLYPSGYVCGWIDLLYEGVIPSGGYWWLATIFILLFVISWIWTGWFLWRLKIRHRGAKTISLSSLQFQTFGNMMSVVTILPPWLTLLMRNEATIIMTMTVLISIVITYIMSKQGYSSLIFMLWGYKRYEGQNVNGMKIQLLSKRIWRNPNDIRTIVLLSDNFGLVL